MIRRVIQIEHDEINGDNPHNVQFGLDFCKMLEQLLAFIPEQFVREAQEAGSPLCPHDRSQLEKNFRAVKIRLVRMQ